MRAWTDYPFNELGDIAQRAAVRNVLVLFWDQDKYATIIVEDVLTTVKVAYLFEDKALTKQVKPERIRRPTPFDLSYLKVVDGLRGELAHAQEHIEALQNQLGTLTAMSADQLGTLVRELGWEVVVEGTEVKDPPDDYRKFTAPWYVIDAATADQEVGYFGDLIYETNDPEEAHKVRDIEIGRRLKERMGFA